MLALSVIGTFLWQHLHHVLAAHRLASALRMRLTQSHLRLALPPCSWRLKGRWRG